jgi:hypothetical protein
MTAAAEALARRWRRWQDREFRAARSGRKNNGAQGGGA